VGAATSKSPWPYLRAIYKAVEGIDELIEAGIPVGEYLKRFYVFVDKMGEMYRRRQGYGGGI